jgi:N,N-dimethylformamidase
MKSLLGYADKISVAPGETIAFKVSSEDSAAYDAAIVRLFNADTNPAGPGYREQSVPDANWRIAGRPQKVNAGSCAVIPVHRGPSALASFRFSVLVWPTLPDQMDQTIASLWQPASGAGFILAFAGSQGLSLRLGDGTGGSATLHLGLPLLARHWYRVEAIFDVETGRAQVRQQALVRYPGICDSGETGRDTGLRGLGVEHAALVLAARPAGAPGRFAGHFNGRLEAPELHCGEALVGAWDFSVGIGTDVVQDSGPNALHGTLVQGPARGVAGHAWDGTVFDWQRATAQYAAIHFHQDDCEDASWKTDFTWTAPTDLPSGLYAARVHTAQDEDYVPFVVRPRAGGSGARLALIIPTASYLAYANEHLALDAALAERVHDHVPAFGPNDLHLAAHRELGGSLYDVHDDGSGIMTSSRHRPILNMRPKYQSWLGGTGSSLWQLAADTHLLDFLDKNGIACDCITDEDLHAEGAAVLSPYACVMTATHAEYWSTRMHDALLAYRDGGGHIMHMGANALYWRIAFHPTRPGIIEVRRAEVGNGWITPPGEAVHAYSGEPGGLWRRLGRAPQSVVGVGFVGQGFDVSSYYRRLPDSYRQEAAFIFAGVSDEIIGDFGLIGGGAAGLELDRTEPALGTPPNTLVLARSENHTRNYLPTVEDLLINYAGQAETSAVYAEMVYFDCAGGGAVFATGSIAWAGSLSHNGYKNNVSQITLNVLRRFLHANE